MDSLEHTTPISDWDLTVTINREICDHHFLLETEIPSGRPMIFQPGQFFHLLCDPEAEDAGTVPLTLRRPLSIHNARYEQFDRSALAGAETTPDAVRAGWFARPTRLHFLYRVIGRGTQHLSAVAPGARLKGIGPCGKGFSITPAKTAVLVAGGIGIAPLKLLAERLRAERKQVLIYFGAVRRDMLRLGLDHSTAAAPKMEMDDEAGLLDAICGDFDAIGAKVLQICTDDGSIGEKALVTEMLEQGIRGGCVPPDDVCLYACGPAGMLKAAAAIAESHSLPCQVSLEERMACGIGVCYACTCNVSGPDGTARKARVCREGPVFDAREIRWKD